MLHLACAAAANGHLPNDFEGALAPVDQPPKVREFFKWLPGWRVNLLSFYSKVVFKASTWRWACLLPAIALCTTLRRGRTPCAGCHAAGHPHRV
jgi:hypothetical protein